MIENYAIVTVLNFDMHNFRSADKDDKKHLLFYCAIACLSSNAIKEIKPIGGSWKKL